MPTIPVPTNLVVSIQEPRHFRYEQGAPAAVWTIEHGMGFKPAGVYVEDPAGTLHQPTVTYPDDDTVVLIFQGATDGYALLS